MSQKSERESPARTVMSADLFPVAGQVEPSPVRRQNLSLKNENAITVPGSPSDLGGDVLRSSVKLLAESGRELPRCHGLESKGS